MTMATVIALIKALGGGSGGGGGGGSVTTYYLYQPSPFDSYEAYKDENHSVTVTGDEMESAFLNGHVVLIPILHSEYRYVPVTFYNGAYECVAPNSGSAAIIEVLPSGNAQ